MKKKQNCYILSGSGFYKKTEIVKKENETPEKIIRWTPNLRNAQSLTSKQAQLIISSNNLDAFIWNPYKEEPIKDKWEVVQRDSTTNFNTFEYDYHKALEWVVRKVVMQSKTDIKFIQNINSKQNQYYSYEDAVNIAIERNNIMIQELIEKTEKIKAQYIKDKKNENIVYLQEWEETERGWGTRPDGCSLHISEEGYKMFIQKIVNERGDIVPDEYDRPIGNLIKVKVSDLVYQRINMNLGNTRLYQNEYNILLTQKEIEK